MTVQWMRWVFGGIVVIAVAVAAIGCAPRSNATISVENQRPFATPSVANEPVVMSTPVPTPAPPSAITPEIIASTPVPAVPTPSASTAGWAVDDAAQAQPLRVGDRVPNVRLASSDGAPVDLEDLVKSRPTVLIFYRGGWCPYCNTHLSELQAAEQELMALGYRIVAISPDRPEKIRETAENLEVSYILLSDSKAEAVRAFGLAFTVDEGTIKRYLGFGINLDEASGEGHHQLPVPAVFIVGKDGVIRYRYYNPDYTARLSKDELLAKAREVK